MIIHAPNIHTGGGKGLLLEVISAMSTVDSNADSDVILILDQRFIPNFIFPKSFQVFRFAPSLMGRLLAEVCLSWLYFKRKQKVLCFGNLPPLFPGLVKADLFFQNMILLKKHSHYKFSMTTKVKHGLERFWLRLGMKNIERFFVQSNATKESVLEEFPNINIQVTPFIGHLKRLDIAPKELQFDFLYVSSGDPHKNHLNLLKAWELLAAEGIYPKLAITVANTYQQILAVVEEFEKKGIKIINFAALEHQQVFELYAKSGALIFPSFCESFGMPLLEAKMLDIPILASELDYVREFVDPVQTFDPHSAVSIARAVKRYLNIPDVKEEVVSAEEFLKQLNS